MTGWAISLAVAGAVGLVATPLVRQVALATGFVDHPTERKAHGEPVPYLGGVAIMVAVLAGLAAGVDLAWSAVAVVLAAVGLGLVGLLDDAIILAAAPRLAAQAALAAVAAGAGVRFELTGIGPLDVAVTVLWIMAVSNALNLVDNMDGQSAGLAAAGAAGVLALGVAADLPVLAAYGGAVATAAVGFVVWNLSPARVFMGDAGSAFLGFSLAILAAEAAAAVPGWEGRLVALLVVAVPLADLGTVVVGRRAHGLGVGRPGKDHLSHRLLWRGLRRRPAVAFLVVTQAFTSAVAVALARGVIGWLPAVALAVVALGALVAATWPADVYPDREAGRAAGIVRRWGLPLVLAGAPVGIAALAWAPAEQHGPGALVAGEPAVAVAAILGAGLVVAVAAAVVVTVRTRPPVTGSVARR